VNDHNDADDAIVRRSAKPISRASAVRAVAAGATSYREGHPVSRCPFPADGPLEDRFRRHWWVRGWSLAAGVA
jgi:hypothetical protein